MVLIDKPLKIGAQYAGECGTDGSDAADLVPRHVWMRSSFTHPSTGAKTLKPASCLQSART